MNLSLKRKFLSLIWRVSKRTPSKREFNESSDQNQSKLNKSSNEGMKKNLSKCLTPKCDKYHWLSNCEITYMVESRRLRNEHKKKRQKAQSNTGAIRRVGAEQVDNHLHFSAQPSLMVQSKWLFWTVKVQMWIWFQLTFIICFNNQFRIWKPKWYLQL